MVPPVGTALIVTSRVTVQPFVAVNVIVDVPADTPTNSPEIAPIVATAGVPLIQDTPGPVGHISVDCVPIHAKFTPMGVPGFAFAVKVVVFLHVFGAI